MTRGPRRNQTPPFKSKVALAAIRGEHTLGELGQQFDVHPNRIKQGRDQLLAGAGDVSLTGRRSRLKSRRVSALPKACPQQGKHGLRACCATGTRAWHFSNQLHGRLYRLFAVSSKVIVFRSLAEPRP